MGQGAWFQSSAILGATFFNSAWTKRLFSERLVVSDELLVLQWRSRIFVQKLILFNFYPFWHISYHNNVAQKWVIRDSLWGESCVPLAKMLPRRFLTRIGLYWQTMRLIWLEFGWVLFYLRFYEPRPTWGPLKRGKEPAQYPVILTEHLVNKRFITCPKRKLFLVRRGADHRIRFILTGRKTASHIV